MKSSIYAYSVSKTVAREGNRISYIGTHKTDQTKVFIKSIFANSEDQLFQFKLEKYLVSSLNPECFVTQLLDSTVSYYEALHGTKRVAYHTINEYFPGNLELELKKRAAEGIFLGENEMFRLVKVMLLGLKELDSKRLKLKEVIPANFLCSLEGDFKINNTAIKLNDKRTYSKKAEVYLPPELQEKETSGHSSSYFLSSKYDLYSVGLILLEIATLKKMDGLTRSTDFKAKKADLIKTTEDIYGVKFARFLREMLADDINARPDINSLYRFMTSKNEYLNQENQAFTAEFHVENNQSLIDLLESGRKEMIETISVRKFSIRDYLQSIINLKFFNLKHLILEDCNLNNGLIKFLTESDNLISVETLSLGFNPRLTSEIGKFIAESPYLKRISSLNLQNNNMILDEFLVHLSKGSTLSSLSKLNLSGCLITEEGCDILNKSGCLENLVKLYLVNCYIKDEGLKIIASCKNLLKLELLHLGGRTNKITDVSFKTLCDNNTLLSLKTLNISFSKTTSKAIRFLCGSVFCSKLNSLDISGTGIDNEGLLYLTRNSKMTDLREISLSGTQIANNSFNEFCRSSIVKNLEVLDVSTTYLTDDGLFGFTRSRFLSNLKTFTFDGCKITDLGVKRIFLSENTKNLTSLNLISQELTKKSLENLTQSWQFHHLRALNVQGLQIGDQTLRLISSSPKLKHLEELDLTENGITSKGLGFLINGEVITKLKKLILYFNQIDDEGITKLSQSKLAENIEYLDIGMNQVTAESVKNILKSRHFGCLKHLLLSWLKGGDKVIDMICQSPKAPYLETLDLTALNLTSNGLKTLCACKTLNRLKKLILESCKFGQDALPCMVDSTLIKQLHTLKLGSNDIPVKVLEQEIDNFSTVCNFLY